MFCSRCGQAMPEGAMLCANCGEQSALTNAPLAGLSSQLSAGAPGSLAPQKTSSMAIASLIFGILFIFFPLSIPAIVFGHIALSQIKKSSGRMGGRGMAIAGLVLGYLGIAMIPLILIIAAIAIPNLLRARIAANESSAAHAIREIDTAQVTYQATYPAIGYARDLATLGGGDPCTASQATACLIENKIAVATLPPGLHGYVFAVVTSAVCCECRAGNAESDRQAQLLLDRGWSGAHGRRWGCGSRPRSLRVDATNSLKGRRERLH
jgi:type II secretory pathway pseudopilin PulG